MKLETVVLGVGVAIVAVVLLTQHWQIASSGAIVYRLDRWTGTITVCAPRSSLDIGKEADCSTRPSP